MQRLDRFQRRGWVVEESDQILQLALVVSLGGCAFGGDDVDHVFFGDVAERDDLGDQIGCGAITLKLRVLHDRQAVVAAQRNFLAVLSARVVVVKHPAAGFLTFTQPDDRAGFTWSSSHVSWPYVISIRAFQIQMRRRR